MTQFYRSSMLLLAALHLAAYFRGQPYTLKDHLHMGLLAVGVWIAANTFEFIRSRRKA